MLVETLVSPIMVGVGIGTETLKRHILAKEAVLRDIK